MKNIFVGLLTTGLFLFLCVFSQPALALPTCSVSDVTAGGGNAGACLGAFAGNDTGSGTFLADLNADTFGSPWDAGDWQLEDKSDEGPNFFTADQGSTSGNWAVASPISGPFIITLKAANSFSAYFFDASFSPITTGTFVTDGVATNGQGKPQDLSHASLWVQTSVSVPEASSLLLLGMGLFGLVSFKKSKIKK